MESDIFGAGINLPLLRALNRLKLNNKKILSLGCGSCALEAVLEKKFFCEVIGLDYSKLAIAKAKTRIKKAFVINLEKKSIKSIIGDNKFDVIVFADILEHLRNPDAVLKECKDLLSNEGKIVVSIPNIANWSVRLNLLQQYLMEPLLHSQDKQLMQQLQ